MYTNRSKRYIFLINFIFVMGQASAKWYTFFVKSNVFPGIFHNDSSGIASSSLIVNADIDSAAAITDGKLATISTAGKVANSATTATSSNVATTIVLRDGTGGFAAQNISMVEGLVSGYICIPTTSSSTVGTIQQSSSSFIHSYGTNNTFVGKTAGNFTMSGTGSNTAVGTNALSSNTTGAQNTIIGASGGTAVTTGSNNVLVGYNIGASTTTGTNNIYIDGNSLSPANESNTIRIGNTQSKCFIQGISGVTVVSVGTVVVSSAGQLGVLLSSARFKHDIDDLAEKESDRIYALRPVSFVYNQDTTETQQYGLIAEEVAQVFPELVVYEDSGLPMTVRYEILPVLLLNEMKKYKDKVDLLEEAFIHLRQRVEAFLQ